MRGCRVYFACYIILNDGPPYGSAATCEISLGTVGIAVYETLPPKRVIDPISFANGRRVAVDQAWFLLHA